MQKCGAGGGQRVNPRTYIKGETKEGKETQMNEATKLCEPLGEAQRKRNTNPEERSGEMAMVIDLGSPSLEAKDAASMQQERGKENTVRWGNQLD